MLPSNGVFTPNANVIIRTSRLHAKSMRIEANSRRATRMTRNAQRVCCKSCKSLLTRLVESVNGILLNQKMEESIIVAVCYDIMSGA